jgi:hypothetical protein
MKKLFSVVRHNVNGWFPDITIAVEDEKGNHKGEFTLEWVRFDGAVWVVRLVCYNDGFYALRYCKDLINMLKEYENVGPTLASAVKWMRQNGYIDVTPEVENEMEFGWLPK